MIIWERILLTLLWRCWFVIRKSIWPVKSFAFSNPQRFPIDTCLGSCLVNDGRGKAVMSVCVCVCVMWRLELLMQTATVRHLPLARCLLPIHSCQLPVGPETGLSYRVLHLLLSPRLCIAVTSRRCWQTAFGALVLKENNLAAAVPKFLGSTP